MFDTVSQPSPYAEAFGYRLYLPDAVPGCPGSFNSRIASTIGSSEDLRDLFRRVCALGCRLIYKPRSRCFYICPESGAALGS